MALQPAVGRVPFITVKKLPKLDWTTEHRNLVSHKLVTVFQRDNCMRLNVCDISRPESQVDVLRLAEDVQCFCAVEASEISDGSVNTVYILAVTGKDIFSLELVRVWRDCGDLKYDKNVATLPEDALCREEGEDHGDTPSYRAPFLWFDSSSSYFAMLHGSRVFRILVSQQGHLSVSDHFPLEIPGFRDDVVSVHQGGGFLFLLHSTGDVSIFNSRYFYQAARISFRDYVKELFKEISSGIDEVYTNQASAFAVSEDLRTIVLTFTGTKYGIFKIQLNEYFAQFPSHLFCENSRNTEGSGTAVPSTEAFQALDRSQTWQGFMKRTQLLVGSDPRSRYCRYGVTSKCAHDWFEAIHRPPADSSSSSLKTKLSRQSNSKIAGFLSKREKRVISPKVDSVFQHSTAVKTPKTCRDLSVTGLFLTESSVVVWYKGQQGGKHGGVCCGSLEEQDVNFYSFTEPTFLAPSVEPAQPIGMVCGDKLNFLAVGMNQDTLVNKLMIYKNASLAENVSQLNQWDHCSIPIHALEVGLRHRQLDTVAFFLKGRETEFRLRETGTDPTSELETSQLWTALNLLSTTISENMKDGQSQQYAWQLLNLTLSHLNKLIQNATESKAKVSETGNVQQVEDLSEVISRLMRYIKKLRKYLKHYPTAASHSETDGKESECMLSSCSWVGLHPQPGSLFSKWRTVTHQEIIKDAILTRNIPLAQALLREQRGESKLGDVMKVGQAIAYSALIEGDIETAQVVFHNMGFDVSSELKKICYYSANSNLRDYLITKLRETGHISKEEDRICLFINSLERLYTCQSFEKAKNLAEEGLMSSWKDDALQLPSLQDPESKKFLEGNLRTGEIVPSSETTNCENFYYAHVLFDWVKHWDKTTQDCILLERLIHSKSMDISTMWSISSESAWRFLLAHEEWTTLKCWIEHSFLSPSEVCSSGSLPQIAPILQDLTLERDFVNRMDYCTSYFKERVLDEMARHGIFSSAELSSFDKLLSRLVRNGQLLVSPHALTRFPESQPFVDSFNEWFIMYCIHQQLPTFLYHFMEFYNLCLSENEVSSMQLPTADLPWLDILLNFRWVGKQISDPAFVFQASLANSRLLQAVTQPSVTSLLQDGHVMVALTTLLYAPGTISEAFEKPSTSAEKLWRVDPAILEESLKPYPKLRRAIFPPQEQDGVHPQDITVYQLLKGNIPVHHSKTFVWQSSNNVAENTDPVLKEMPHFANADLVKQFAYTESFSFTHYLRQGRPSFAFSAFIVNLLQEGATICKYKIAQAYLKSYCTAIRNISKPSVTAACVAFAEMLGKSSTFMRVDIHCASVIMDFHKSSIVPSSRAGRKMEKKIQEEFRSKEKELASLLMGCLKRSRNSAQSVLQQLEAAITDKVNQQYKDRTSWEATETWALAVLFCQRHNLPYSTVYLRECAERNQWLSFTCFAQIHQYPQSQILELVKMFTNPALRDHLSSAFENMKFGSAPSKPEQPLERKDQLRSTKNIRAKFYAKSGVLPKTEDQIKKTPLTVESDDNSDEGLTSEDQTDDGDVDDDEMVESKPEDLDVKDIPEDFFGVIFRCDAHSRPHSALLAHAVALGQPIFAVISSCYQNSSALDCLCTWLYAIIGHNARSKFMTSFKFEVTPSFQWHSWTLVELYRLIHSAVATGAINLVCKGFFIFDKDCPFNSFLKFCFEFLLHHDVTTAKDQLDSFHSAIQKCKRYESVQQTHFDASHRPKIGNLRWYQESANGIVRFMLSTCSSLWELSNLLQILSEVNFSLVISSSYPDYSLLHQLNVILKDSKEEQNHFRKLVNCPEESFSSVSELILEMLRASDQFNKAKMFARLVKLPVDDLVVSQVEKELLKSHPLRIQRRDKDELSFWQKCNELFKANRVKPKTVVAFYQGWVHKESTEVTLSSNEKAFILHLAYEWMKKVSQGSEVSQLEREMWTWRLKVESEKRVGAGGQLPSLQNEEKDVWQCKSQGPQELLFVDRRKGRHDDDDDEEFEVLSQEQLSALSSILSKLLQRGCVIQANHLASQFDHYCQDLEIILSCIRLAKGTIHVLQLDGHLKRLIGSDASDQRQRRTTEWQKPGSQPLFVGSGTPPIMRRSASVVSMPVNFVDQNVKPEVEDETLKMMKLLLSHCEDGKKCCEQIITCYQVSKALKRSYEEVVTMLPLDTLKTLLDVHNQERIELAKKFVQTNSLSDNEVASFLTELVLTSLRKSSARRKDGVVSRLAVATPQLSPWAARTEFSSLLKLCENPAVLGNKLMEEVISLISSHKDPTMQGRQGDACTVVLSLEVELLIRSHDCFSICCHIEGISNVLRSSREIFNSLVEFKEYPLMVRLLLGVARYSEMTYLFNELRAKQQIELLLKKGSKDNSLKISLLDYLKHCDPPDPETYNMVAVKFGMVREIATLLEKEGVKKLNSVSNRKMDTNLEVQNSLEEILQDFKNAAQNYAKADCLRHAERCVQQARLVALQLHLLSHGVRVVNLTDAELNSFLTKHGNFHQAYIVYEAYGKQFDWSSSIYYHVIEKGDFAYFEDYRNTFDLSESIFTEVSQLYGKEKSRVSAVTNNMKQLVMICPGIVAKYKIASELGFQEITLLLLQDANGAYLKDVAMLM